MEEKWRPVKGYEDFYLVSNKGKVLGIKRRRVLKPYKEANGRLRVTLYKPQKYPYQGGNKFGVHQLVARSWIKDYDWDNGYGECVNHMDGNPLNNDVRNLEIVSLSDNLQHGIKNNMGCCNAKLKHQEVWLLKKLLKDGYESGIVTQATLSKMFKVSDAQISRIYLGKRRASYP